MTYMLPFLAMIGAIAGLGIGFAVSFALNRRDKQSLTAKVMLNSAYGKLAQSADYSKGYSDGYAFGRAAQAKEDEAALVYFRAAKDILNGHGPYLHGWP